MRQKKDKCATCVYRTRPGLLYKCDYASMTGHTRLAVPPEKCRHYTPEGKAPERKTRTRPDWDAAMILWERGMNDAEIAAQMGCSRYTVQGWRYRNKLHANCGKGKRIV